MNTTSRPMFLNLFQMKFPPMAIVSIMHRISGVLLFLLLPYALYLLGASLYSQECFGELQIFLASPFEKFIVWVLVSCVAMHLFAGIRHLLMDCGVGESLSAGRTSAYLIFIVEIIAMIAAGVWIW